MKARYLTFFSYIGSGFRSSEKIWLKEKRNFPDPASIQGLLELSLLGLKSMNYPNVTLSSRTDGGVHALNCSAHFDLDRYGPKIYDPNRVTYLMNKFLYKNNHSIYVKSILRVNDNFNARYKAIHRTYLYRLAVLKQDSKLPECLSIASVIPIEEWRRCHFVRLPGFDIERFKACIPYLIGLHDWTTFKKHDKLHVTKHNRRELKSMVLRPGRPTVTDYTLRQASEFDYWDIEIQGRAFVHNQIRRMIGTLLAVGLGRLEPHDVKVMLQVPSKHSWHHFIQTTPPHGLYLCDVAYNPEDLVYNPDVAKEIVEEEDDIETE